MVPTNEPRELMADAPPTSRVFRAWEWGLFVLPGLTAVIVPHVLNAMNHARDKASGYTWLSDYDRAHMNLYTGMGGLIAGSCVCLPVGIWFGLRSKGRHPVLASLGWAVLCAAANLVLASAGCGMSGLLN